MTAKLLNATNVRSKSMVSLSQRCQTRRSTRHTILWCDELSVWWVDWFLGGVWGGSFAQKLKLQEQTFYFHLTKNYFLSRSLWPRIVTRPWVTRHHPINFTLPGIGAHAAVLSIHFQSVNFITGSLVSCLNPDHDIHPAGIRNNFWVVRRYFNGKIMH